MLRLTPLRETMSGQELIKEERVALLARLIQVKFALLPEMMEVITADLEKLKLEALQALIDVILRIDTVEQLERWIADHLPPHKT